MPTVSIAYDESDAGSSGWPAVPIKPQCRPNSADSGLLPNDGFGANLAVRYPSRERPFSDGERKPVGRVTCFR